MFEFLYISAIQTGSPQLRKRLKPTGGIPGKPVQPRETTQLNVCNVNIPNPQYQNGFQSVENGLADRFLPRQLNGHGDFDNVHYNHNGFQSFNGTNNCASLRKRTGSTGSSDRDSLYNTSNDNLDSGSDKSSGSSSGQSHSQRQCSKVIFPGFQFQKSVGNKSPSVDELEYLCSNLETSKTVQNDSLSSKRWKSGSDLQLNTQETLEIEKRSREFNSVSESSAQDQASNVHDLVRYPLFFPQWRNQDALCWLDVILCLSVHIKALKGLADDSDFDQNCLVYKLLKAHEQAKQILQTISERKSNAKSRLSNCSNSSHLKTRSGSSSSVRQSKSDAAAEEESLTSIKTDVSISGVEWRKSKGAELLNMVREEIWGSLKTKLRCERGQHESPVFAFPLLLKQNRQATELFRVKYK